MKSKSPHKAAYITQDNNLMELYPNQAAVTIRKVSDNYANDKIQFCSFSTDCWFYASKVLEKKTALQLYTYLLMNANGYQKALSPRFAEMQCGIPRRSYYRARDELIEKGFMRLIQSVETGAQYDAYEFYESPYDNPEWSDWGSTLVM